MPAAVALACLPVAASPAQEVDSPVGIVAAQVRTQGYSCSEALSATRDRLASRPNAAVWVLRCRNARYRVRLVPDMAAQITQLD